MGLDVIWLLSGFFITWVGADIYETLNKEKK